MFYLWVPADPRQSALSRLEVAQGSSAACVAVAAVLTPVGLSEDCKRRLPLKVEFTMHPVSQWFAQIKCPSVWVVGGGVPIDQVVWSGDLGHFLLPKELRAVSTTNIVCVWHTFAQVISSISHVFSRKSAGRHEDEAVFRSHFNQRSAQTFRHNVVISFINNSKTTGSLSSILHHLMFVCSI